MKLIMKFADGVNVEIDAGEPKIEGVIELVALLLKGQRETPEAVIDINRGALERKFKELVAVEIVVG